MSEINVDEVELNGVKYIRKDSVNDLKMANKVDGMPYVLVRTYSAGVHIGYLSKKEGKEVTLLNSRRVYYWSGAATLSQLAMEGSKKQFDCKLTMEVNSIELMEAIEVIPVSDLAFKNLNEIKIWKM